jgi:membrane associated rhomboid family serine protease
MVFVCTAAFLIIAALDVLHVADKRLSFTYLGLSYYGVIKQHWYWQFLTAPIIHGGLAHLLFNMLALWMLGPQVEENLGKGRYVVLVVISAFSAMIATLVANWGTGTITLGFSGVIYGILVAQAMFYPENRIMVFALFPMKMKHAVFLFAAIELYLTVSPEGGIVSNVSHLFGAAGAFVYLKGRDKLAQSRQIVKLKETQKRARAAVRKAKIERKVPRKL